jgi:hypothetical protein
MITDKQNAQRMMRRGDYPVSTALSRLRQLLHGIKDGLARKTDHDIPGATAFAKEGCAIIDKLFEAMPEIPKEPTLREDVESLTTDLDERQE